ncbi:unnamed protein product [Prorocentrum cordatum]|uniref:Uncharacterized protein n=1 Tax=Prorocentrum cordatum TaxID=2364126 RepID=A0ABN9UVR9_9DINO|nr:unnamed protein product [Polarella glacialis]
MTKMLETHPWAGISCWSTPVPSTSDRLHRLVVYQDGKSVRTSIFLDMTRARLRNIADCAIGHTNMLHDPGALIVDYTAPAGVFACRQLYDELVLLTAKRGVLIVHRPFTMGTAPHEAAPGRQ